MKIVALKTIWKIDDDVQQQQQQQLPPPQLISLGFPSLFLSLYNSFSPSSIRLYFCPHSMKRPQFALLTTVLSCLIDILFRAKWLSIYPWSFFHPHLSVIIFNCIFTKNDGNKFKLKFNRIQFRIFYCNSLIFELSLFIIFFIALFYNRWYVLWIFFFLFLHLFSHFSFFIFSPLFSSRSLLAF